MQCARCGSWTVAVFDSYGWAYTCECGHVVHLSIQTESRSLDDPEEEVIQEPSAESGKSPAERAVANVLRLYPMAERLRG